MIHLQRPAPPPEWGDRAGSATRAVSKINIQTRYVFDESVVHDPSVTAELRAVNGGRCAFCESPEGVPAPVSIDRFRPTEEATDLDGTPHREHYHWLAYEWDNLVPVCGYCTSSRGRRFPVTGKRAPVFAVGVDLEREQRLLLDPYVDDPELVFGYAADGSMFFLTPQGDTTMAVLNLNRPQLVEARRAAAADVEIWVDEQSIHEGSERVVTELHRQVGGELPYTGARRYALRHALVNTPLLRWLFGDVTLAEAADRLHVGGPAFTAAMEHLMPRAAMAEPPPTPAGAAEAGALRVESIEIADLKAIEHLVLTFPPPTPDHEPWIVLLGENGVGKSTVLKALALALMTPDERRRRVADASIWVRRAPKVRRGSARLTFSDGQVIELIARTGSPEFTIVGTAPPQVVLGYGPTRLPPNAAHQPVDGDGLHVDNLFDPWVPLDDVEGWLSDTTRVPTDEFNLHATDLRTLLPLDPEDLLVRRRGRLYAKADRTTVPLAELSDGFRSVIALATDMMLHLSVDSTSMRTAAGIVLVDELEVHLHPQWKLTIVGLLRQVFPQVRFIVSTHDPLCLQSTEPGEVFVLMRDADERVQARQADVPKGLRADQLLTGQWFGLSTTVDEETAALVSSHGALLLQTQTPEVLHSRESLEERIRLRLGHFAETAPERMAQSIAAELTDGRDLRDLSADDRAALRDDVLAAVRERGGGTP